MKQINEKTIIATAEKMNDSGYFSYTRKNDPEVYLWIKWKWVSTNDKEHFVPLAELYSEMIGMTHKISNEELYFKLPKGDTCDFFLEEFITRFIPIERL